ncbi:hypothetical protein C1940_08905 [Lactiplantibacillus plantarum subsp. plantarum]|uniref:hypothetical protein n=1 Tax=Lactiplantibacillus plantarum TaxID=1590 RepID=UPI000CD338E8|nr:hypothetical protein [Lactiplantibacillus plantarum]AUV72577.1 hypothetical protein C1940_08905 [Lactiplantibacillus plantarum subsp. plantarum]
MDELTNDAKYFLAVTYKQYLNNIDNGSSKHDARELGDAPDFKQLFPEWEIQDISDTANELKNIGYVKSDQYWCPYPSNVELTSKAIVYCKQRFKRDVKSIMKTIIDLKSLLF